MEKYIRIEIVKEEDGIESVLFDCKGLSEFEIIGMLTYYRDKVQIDVLNQKKDNSSNVLRGIDSILDDHYEGKTGIEETIDALRKRIDMG